MNSAAIATALIVFSMAPAAAEPAFGEFGSAPAFSLIDENGAVFTDDNLQDRVWIAEFFFTRCAQCASVSSRLSELSRTLPDDIVFVSFSLDPSHDSIAVLRDYKAAYHDGASEREWKFLTGTETAMHALTQDGFRLSADRDTTATDPSVAIIHSLRLAMVDRDGHIRAYVDSEDTESLAGVRTTSLALLHSPLIVSLPRWNAALNLLCACLLVNGLLYIRRGNVAAHKICMISAFAVSALFLTCYLIYHYEVGSVRFQSQGPIRTIYFAILISHTVLAAVNVPLILTTLFLGLTGRWEKHRRFARVTFPSWLYVSVTGILVYWLLYHVDA